jgi:hypothetical protein
MQESSELFVKMKPCKEEMIREKKKKSFGRFWFRINYLNFTKKKIF